MGDLAMLQVGVSRLEKLFPGASINVFTLDPKELKKSLPGTNPISPRGRDTWVWPLVHKLHNSQHSSLRQKWQGIERYLIQHQPQLRSFVLKLKLQRFPDESIEMERFLGLLREADLVVATGGGFVTDTFMKITSPKLDTLAYAAKLGKKTAFLGQGLGPLENPANYRKAKEALAMADLIFLREKRVGLPLLTEMGVESNKIAVTGDDAIELAFNARQPNVGSAIGINLRMASYSSVNHDYVDNLRSVLHRVALEKSADLLPIPIEHAANNQSTHADSNSIKSLLCGYDNSSDGGASLNTPLKVIQQVSKCRFVITGSYHAGVFALSQGIPVLGLAKSKYYIDKFSGLAEQFPGGCEVILLSDQEFKETLELKMNNLWENAEKLRPQLLASAQEQIELGHLAYKRIYDLCTPTDQRLAIAV
ncbi:polysaccharide pyruvyl transferase family protein [Pseudanabaena sp. FACHB-2040]|nr:polysaccharide pyruvyl transferase family protein [Pseudanabaena sp. FACHB-2040]MBD2260571.1 polysaccharide pyruvyl transferase family protein [Pseudanabaena sp. FACHB-2040]